MSFFQLIDLTELYFSPTQYTDVSYSILDLSNAGYTINDLYKCGYTVYDLSNLNVYEITDYINSIIPVDGSNGLVQIISQTSFLDASAEIINYFIENPTEVLGIARLFNYFTILELYNNGFSISFMHDHNISIHKVYELVNNPDTNPYVTYLDLKLGGYTLSDIYSLNTDNPIINLKNIYEYYNYPIKEYYKAGFTASELKYANIDTTNKFCEPINPQTLFQAGYTILNLYDASYTYADLSNAGFTKQEILKGGIINIIELIGIQQSDIILNELVTVYNASLNNLLNIGYTLNDLSPYCSQYYTINEFLSLGYTFQQLYDASFSAQAFYSGYYYSGIPTFSELLTLGYSSKNLIPLDIHILEYYDSSYSSLDLFNNGFNLLFLKNNYSLNNFKRDGINTYTIYESNLFTIYEFNSAGYILSDYYISNIPVSFIGYIYSLYEVTEGGYNINTTIATHFYPASSFFNLNYAVSLLTSYYTVDELFTGGYSKKELNIDGLKLEYYCSRSNSCKSEKPSKLGSSMNNTTSSSKMSYSSNISSKRGGSYTTTYSEYLANKDNINILCANSLISTSLSTNIPSCKATIIPGKQKTKLSYFIRNYIINELKKIIPNPSNQQIQNTINQITIINNQKQNQPQNQNISIYTIIQDYLYQ
jgi:hypothetical protein